MAHRGRPFTGRVAPSKTAQDFIHFADNIFEKGAIGKKSGIQVNIISMH
jgi:hypothetical protein